MPTAREKTLLNQIQIEEALTELEGWEYKGARLERVFKTRKFMPGLEFVNELAQVAEALNHHPDVFLTFNKVKIQLVTHDLNGISTLDVALAKKINEIAVTNGLG